MPADHHAAPGLDPALASALTQELTRHARLLHAMKATMASLVPEGLDPGAFPLLLMLVRCGPRRQGELAEMSLLDPSTVSRQVAKLESLVREAPKCIMSPRLLAECRTFVSRRDGKMGASAGSHDDLVMAMAIAEAVRVECRD